jgi:acyl phosphate:glycerol-3-phosphate acyltransferase
VLTLAAVFLLSYLLGSVPSALIVGRVHGVYLERLGSGNAGATNALRVLGPRLGAVVFAADILKGLLAVVLLSRIRLGGGLPGWLGPNADTWAAVLAGSAAILGHVYTVIGLYFYGKARGGKGVATAGGAFFGLIPVAAAVGFVLFWIVVGLTRFVSLGSIVAALSLPITVVAQRALGVDIPAPIFILTLLVPPFILYTHRANIKRLLAGTESRFGQRVEPSP